MYTIELEWEESTGEATREALTDLGPELTRGLVDAEIVFRHYGPALVLKADSKDVLATISGHYGLDIEDVIV